MRERYLAGHLRNHLKSFRQMVFLVGPRQVGKTILAKSMLAEVRAGINYFNWDLQDHRRILLTQIFTGDEQFHGPGRDVIVFDEIHKHRRWKNDIKGLFDLHEPETHWIITGSALLDVYRRGQDSLLGRHFTYRLCPFSVAEWLNKPSHKVPTLEDLAHCEIGPPTKESEEAYESLRIFGGFPEPLLKGEEAFLARWRSSRLDRLINQDLASTEMLKNLSLVERLMFLLPERVGSPLSLNSLREILEVHFATVKHWMDLLERSFYGFFVHPYAKRSSRMLRKEAKWYLWDWTELADPAKRFENLVAVHLLKYVTFLKDTGLEEASLHYVRDKEKREVDFLICKDRKPFLLLECKVGEREPDPALGSFARILGVEEVIQLVERHIELRVKVVSGCRIRSVPAASFLDKLV